ncbi:MAG: NUDIX domain-containing protein [Candidatus Aenigmarchaeota archaeon]|nr:NUDIX domain-containing protein [Candidatus Aenigmarchaeota archaeon]
MERSRGAVIFRKSGRKILYLLLHYESGHWDFVKGHVEKGESDEETVKREAKEETQLDVTVLPGFRKRITYFFRSEGRTVMKEVIFYIAEAKKSGIKLSFEHRGSKWLPFKEAMEKITYKNSKAVLEKANKFLAKR